MNARRLVYVLSVLVLLLAVVAGCNRARNDAQIAGDVVTKINTDANVPTKQITVTSNNGVVTLAGNVTSDAERAAAANDAAQIEGVKTVVNNLSVAPTTAAASPAPQPVQEEQPQPEPAPRATARRHASRSSAARSYSAPAPSAPAMTSTAPAQMAAAPAPPPPPPPPKPVTIADGTVLAIRTIDPIDTATANAGDTFRATLDSPVTIDDNVVIPRGAEIVGRIAEAKGAGHFAGRPELALELSSLKMNGRQYTLHTNQYTKQGDSRGKNTAEKVGGGAAVGAVIGAIAGGGKGAAIGSVIGAGAGGGVQAATKAKQIQVPSEALLSFRLESPITVMPVSSVSRGSSASWNNSSPNNDYTDSTVYNDPNSTTDPNAPVLKRRP